MTMHPFDSERAMTSTTCGTWEKIMWMYRRLIGNAVVVVLLLGAVVVIHGWQPIPAADTPTSGKLTAGSAFDVTPDLDEGDQRWPAVAAGKGVYLVVWQEGEAMAGVKDTNIFAARVSADGKLLDPKAIPVCTATSRYSLCGLVICIASVPTVCRANAAAKPPVPTPSTGCCCTICSVL